jgi:hypothetical protein
MDEKSRLQLQKMIKANDVEDVTDLIRELKHSHILENDINQLLLLKAKYRNDPDKIHEQGMQDCGFLFAYYTDIYNKVRKDEIDLTILNKFLNILRRIEDGDMDQHDGAFLVGSLLKELYVDSALRKADKLNENEKEPEKPREKVEISWKNYKKML